MQLSGINRALLLLHTETAWQVAQVRLLEFDPWNLKKGREQTCSPGLHMCITACAHSTPTTNKTEQLVYDLELMKAQKVVNYSPLKNRLSSRFCWNVSHIFTHLNSGLWLQKIQGKGRNTWWLYNKTVHCTCKSFLCSLCKQSGSVCY